ncbi:MAG: hypothetical protein LBS49_11570 [Candidatus Accumulibacter sp.]|jgi:hypothetical protein|nr:hypothetical protein [Accumulibacter sp.]
MSDALNPGRAISPAALWKNWTSRKPGEKNLHVAVVAVILAALYFVALYPMAAKEVNIVSYNMEKARARAKANAPKTGPGARGRAAPNALGGPSRGNPEKELETLRLKLEEARAAVGALRGSYVPLDDSLAMNVLKTGLTALAEAGDMEVLSIEHVYARAEDKNRPPTPQLLQEAARGNAFQRPLLVMRARASYRGLMHFLLGLVDLPYVAAPVWSDISVAAGGKSSPAPAREPTPASAATRQWLDVTIRFAV